MTRTRPSSADHAVRPPTWDSDAFTERLRSLLGSESENSFGTRSGVGASLFSKYLRGSMPGADKALLIARAAGVTVDWLLTGEGTKEAGEPQARYPLEEEQLRDCFVAVEEYLADHGVFTPRGAPAEKRITLAVDLYREVIAAARKGRSVSPAEMIRLLRSGRERHHDAEG